MGKPRPEAVAAIAATIAIGARTGIGRPALTFMLAIAARLAPTIGPARAICDEIEDGTPSAAGEAMVASGTSAAMALVSCCRTSGAARLTANAVWMLPTAVIAASGGRSPARESGGNARAANTDILAWSFSMAPGAARLTPIAAAALRAVR